MPKYKVQRLDHGPKWTDMADGKLFDRSSAAHAWLIDHAGTLSKDPTVLIEEDEINPGCFDALIDTGDGIIYQYAINEVK